MGESLLARATRAVGGPEALLAKLGARALDEALRTWEAIARPEQLPPPGDWATWLVLAGRGWGKLLDRATPIPVPTGWKKLADIRIGDEVFDESGRVCLVTETFDALPEVAYRIGFSDGTTIDACGDHQWVTWTHAERKAFLRSPYEDVRAFPSEWPAWRLSRKMGREVRKEMAEKAIAMAKAGVSVREIGRKLGAARQSLARHIKAGRWLPRAPVVHADSPGPQVRTTQQIVDTLTYGRRADLNHCVPMCGALQSPDADLPVDPYVMGAWLGDGDSAGADFTAHQDDQPHLRSELLSAGYTPTKRKDPQRVGTLGLRVDLRDAGVLGNKHVPPVYLRASTAQRLAILQGLMDTDGGVHTGSPGSVEFSNTNPRLVTAVVELARSLGQKPVSADGRAKLYGVDKGPKWRVTWTPTIQVFRLPRKAQLILRGRSQVMRNHHRMIVSAIPIRPTPMRCLTVNGRHSMFLAGEGMIPTHNTASGAHFSVSEISSGRCGRFALVGPTSSDVRDVMVEGQSGVMSIYAGRAADECPVYEPSKRRITWPNGAIATTYSAEEPDRLRGPQHDGFWADELAAWKLPRSTWDQLQFGLRLGSNPRGVVTTTPRPIPLVRELLKEATVTRGTTYENAVNLAPGFLKGIIKRFGGTRLGRQEIGAEILDDNPGALWKLSDIEATRRLNAPVEFRRVAGAIDPAVTSREDSDESGIIFGGIADCMCKGFSELHAFILEDASGTYTPDQWARIVAEGYHRHECDRIIAEINNGGEMVEATLRTLGDPNISYRGIHASRGKAIRAEPVAALYEQKRVHHIGSFPKLEDQLTTWDPLTDSYSPDRLDALVWLLTELLVSNSNYPSIFDVV